MQIIVIYDYVVSEVIHWAVLYQTWGDFAYL